MRVGSPLPRPRPKDVTPRTLSDQHAIRDDRLGQCLAEPVERPRTERIFEARDGRLRGQARPADRVALEQQLLDRIVGQAVRIIGIGIAARDGKTRAAPDAPQSDQPDAARASADV